MRPILSMLILLALMLVVKGSDYDPLAVSNERVETLDLSIQDKSRSREIPVRVYLPKEMKAAPVVLFSHGLGGNREGSAYLGKQWAKRGYVSVFLQHLGSDDGVWKDLPIGQRTTALKEAASLKEFLSRAKDVPAVLNQLEIWNKESGHGLTGRLDLQHIGMSGHSFGAVTTQAVSGQTPALGKGFTDQRITAAIIMSPSGPASGNTKLAFGNVKIPWMLLTGTHDTNPVSGADAKSRLVVFPDLPPGDKYQLVLKNAEHSAFGERAIPGEQVRRNPNHHRAILAVTTAFWDAYLRKDDRARQWLDDSVRSVLEEADQWDKK